MEGRLELEIARKQGRSAVIYSQCAGPLKLGMPGGKTDRLELILMMASAGILKGDSLSYQFLCREGSKAVITEQSYSKIFDTGAGAGQKETDIRLEGDASLFYCPSAVIPFAGSCFRGNMTVALDRESEFLCWDMVTAGRVGMGETFAFASYRNRICVTEEGRPVWLDHCLLEPERMDVRGMVFLDGHTHQGTLYYHGPAAKEERLLDYQAAGPVLMAKTRPAVGVCFRLLADTAQNMEEEFVRMRELVG